jgi:hypothetical protein
MDQHSDNTFYSFLRCLLQILAAPPAILTQLCQNGGVFYRENREQSEGAKSGEWGGLVTTVVLFLEKYSLGEV